MRQTLPIRLPGFHRLHRPQRDHRFVASAIAFRQSRLVLIGVLVLIIGLGTCPPADAAPADVPIAATLAQLTATWEPRTRTALSRIDGTARQLLAARAYLRSGDSLAERWSWSEQQAETFRASDEGQALARAIDAVRCTFEAANPGYSLFVNPAFRSLDVQIERWNHNPSVAAAGENLLRSLRTRWPRGTGAADGLAQVAWLRRELLAHYPHPVPTLAAPGLSRHGQLRAVDFQITRGGVVIAGTSTAAIAKQWEKTGWAVRLRIAVESAAVGFMGPLRTPNESWHYEWRQVVVSGGDCDKD